MMKTAVRTCCDVYVHTCVLPLPLLQFRDPYTFPSAHERLLGPVVTCCTGTKDIFQRVCACVLLLLLLLPQFLDPYTFPSAHERLLEPYNYFAFGQRYVSTLIDFSNSFLGQAEIWAKVRRGGVACVVGGCFWLGLGAVGRAGGVCVCVCVCGGWGGMSGVWWMRARGMCCYAAGGLRSVVQGEANSSCNVSCGKDTACVPGQGGGQEAELWAKMRGEGIMHKSGDAPLCCQRLGGSGNQTGSPFPYAHTLRCYVPLIFSPPTLSSH
jgi:hypothetical protein